MSQESFQERKQEKSPSLYVIIGSRMTGLIADRADFMAGLPPEQDAGRDNLASIRVLDSRIAYLRELLGVVQSYSGFDSAEKTVLHIQSELGKMASMIEDAARSAHYGSTGSNGPADLLAIQIDMTTILETYTDSRH